jgi:hypothetical protein
MRQIDKAIKIIRISALILFVALTSFSLKGDIASAKDQPQIICTPADCRVACQRVGCAKGFCIQGDCVCSACCFGC